MSWNFHKYFADANSGLISHLTLDIKENSDLKRMRDEVRKRTKEIFKEAQKLVREFQQTMLVEGFKVSVRDTKIRHLSEEKVADLFNLVKGLTSKERDAFLSLEPIFWTQGSFKYGTLNKPYMTPPQEMDIDDGTYLPMNVFDKKPIIGHHLLLLLVDASLKSLEAENRGWEFEALPKCARLKMHGMNAHIDVPMYAIPLDEYEERRKAVALTKTVDSVYAAESYGKDESRLGVIKAADYRLDSSCVNLAVRQGDKRWIQSDPKIVEDWFKDCCAQLGEEVKAICRFVKAWRDAQWTNGGGPSSIALMAGIVEVLSDHSFNHGDFGEIISLVARELPDRFAKGIVSPDDTDDKPLFPPEGAHGDKERQIMGKLREFRRELELAQGAISKEHALQRLNAMFGDRGIDASLIVSRPAVNAAKAQPERGLKPAVITPSMVSG